MIDSSDGLSTDLAHICEESGVGAEVEENLIPRALVAKSAVDVKFALHGGEDYELIFTASSRARIPSKIAGVRISKIGDITKNKRMLIHTRGKARELHSEGWEHFC